MTKEDLNIQKLIIENEALRTKIKEQEKLILNNQRLNNKLIDNESFYQSVFEENQAIKFLIDPDTGFFLDANLAACKFYQYSKEEFKSLKIFDINILPENYVKENIREVMKSQKSYFHFRHRLANGQIKDIEAYTSPVTIMGKKMIFSIINDISNLKESEDKLKNYLKKYEIILNLTGDAIHIIDLNGNFYQVNPAFCKMLEIPQTKLLSKKYSEINPDFSKNLGDFINKTTGVQNINFESKYYKNETFFIDVEVNASKVEFDNQNLILLSAHNISERKIKDQQLKQSLKEKDILLKELHHRVKNNLQIISSLLNLQVNNIKDSGILSVFRESQNRIKSISLVHQQLYDNNNFDIVNLHDYINKLSNNLMHSYGISSDEINIEINTSGLELETSRTVIIGLILSEFISNTFKYAYKGSVYSEKNMIINIYLEAENIILEHSDNGKGLAEDFEIKNCKSLGLQLVSMLVQQLEGEIEIKSDKGCYFKIAFPA